MDIFDIRDFVCPSVGNEIRRASLKEVEIVESLRRSLRETELPKRMCEAAPNPCVRSLAKLRNRLEPMNIKEASDDTLDQSETYFTLSSSRRTVLVIAEMLDSFTEEVQLAENQVLILNRVLEASSSRDRRISQEIVLEVLWSVMKSKENKTDLIVSAILGDLPQRKPKSRLSWQEAREFFESKSWSEFELVGFDLMHSAALFKAMSAPKPLGESGWGSRILRALNIMSDSQTILTSEDPSIMSTLSGWKRGGLIKPSEDGSQVRLRMSAVLANGSNLHHALTVSVAGNFGAEFGGSVLTADSDALLESSRSNVVSRWIVKSLFSHGSTEKEELRQLNTSIRWGFDRLRDDSTDSEDA